MCEKNKDIKKERIKTLFFYYLVMTEYLKSII